jgi:hypothetical protein
MNLALAQQFVYLLGVFVESSLVGVLSYRAVKFVRKICPFSSGEVLAVLVWLPHLAIQCVVWMLYVPLMLVAALICLGSALAERKVTKEERLFGLNYGFHYGTVLTASALSCTLGLVVLAQHATSMGTIGAIVCVLGLLLGASTLPVFLWMLRSSLLRPGLDRPFHLHESVSEEEVDSEHHFS